jgi:hypothetical protein
VGNSFVVPVVAWLYGHLLVQEGFLANLPSIPNCWGTLSMAQEQAVCVAYGLPSASDLSEISIEAVRQFCRSALFKGSDVRLATQSVMVPNLWPRLAADTSRWHWKVILSYPAHGPHINVLELKAVLSSFKWRVRSCKGLHVRFAHFLDSQVAMSVLAKGRSSSRQLGAVLRKINALLLASSNFPFYIFVRSEDNPADAPSRWHQWHDPGGA